MISSRAIGRLDGGVRSRVLRPALAVLALLGASASARAQVPPPQPVPVPSKPTQPPPPPPPTTTTKAKPAPAPAPASLPATPDERSRVRAFLGQWLAAWRAQDIEAYLATYAADARVDARDRAAFEQYKRKIFAKGERPVIDVGDVEIDAIDDAGVRLLRARFDQSYASPTVTDFGRKEMLLRDFGSQLVIARETWSPAKGTIEVPLGSEAPETPQAPAPQPEPPSTPLELPPGDELLSSEPLLTPAPETPVLPGMPPAKLEGDRGVVEEIVARINGRVLTRSMLLERIGWYQETLLQEDPPDLEERLKTLAAETLDTTIDRWVLLQEAQRRNADVEGFWRDWVAQTRRQVGAADMAELEQLLSEQGTSLEKLKEQVIETEIPNLYLQQELGTHLTFSEDELRDWFDKHRAQYQPPAAVTFRQILVPYGPGTDAAKAEAIARNVVDQLAAGRDWCELNQIYGQSGTPCTDLENIPLTDLAPELRDAAAGLPIGATSKPIRSSQGVHVLRVSKRVGADSVTFEDVRDAVLRDLRSNVFDRELAKVLDDLRASAVIEINDRYKLKTDSAETSPPLGAPRLPQTAAEPGGGS